MGESGARSGAQPDFSRAGGAKKRMSSRSEFRPQSKKISSADEIKIVCGRNFFHLRCVWGRAGLSGHSGFSGFSGFSGNSVHSGHSGYSGYSGISGHSGPSGISGPSVIPQKKRGFRPLLKKTQKCRRFSAPESSVRLPRRCPCGAACRWLRGGPEGRTARGQQRCSRSAG